MQFMTRRNVSTFLIQICSENWHKVDGVMSCFTPVVVSTVVLALVVFTLHNSCWTLVWSSHGCSFRTVLYIVCLWRRVASRSRSGQDLAGVESGFLYPQQAVPVAGRDESFRFEFPRLPTVVRFSSLPNVCLVLLFFKT
jgi:hypothetical protein